LEFDETGEAEYCEADAEVEEPVVRYVGRPEALETDVDEHEETRDIPEWSSKKTPGAPSHNQMASHSAGQGGSWPVETQGHMLGEGKTPAGCLGESRAADMRWEYRLAEGP
jgi:hypothetical protein